MQYVSSSPLLSPSTALGLYPPFLLMNVKIKSCSPNLTSFVAILPLTFLSRNPGGVMFGGYQACLADPIPALACNRLFPDFSSWTKSVKCNMVKAGTTDLTLTFNFPNETERSIRKDLDARGYSNPKFTYNYTLEDGTVATECECVVAIRKKGYVRV